MARKMKAARSGTLITPAAEKWGRRLLLVILLGWIVAAFDFETGLIILTVTGFACIVLGLFSPSLGLLGIGLLASLDALTRSYLLLGGLFRWNTFNYWLIIVIALNIQFVLRLRDIHSRLIEVLLLLLGLHMFISPSLTTGLQDILNVITYLGY